MNARSRLAQLIRRGQASAGFSLIELITVILILGILSAIAAPKAFNTSKITLDAQAKSLASNLQRAQLLAATTGTSVYFCAFQAGYLVQINAVCPSTLPSSQDFATQPVLVALDKEAILPALPSFARYNSLGQPIDSDGKPMTTQVNFVLTSSSSASSITVSAAAVTGLVSVSP